MKIVVAMFLAVMPLLSQLDTVNLEAKNPGCDPEHHDCSGEVQG